MIKINLLPLDKRKTERTPLKGAGLMIADVIVLVVVVIAIVIQAIQIGNVSTEIEAKKKTLASLQPAVKEHDDLLARSKKLEGEYNDLLKVTGTRPFEWSDVIDAIWDVVAKHKRVWLDDIQAADGKMMDTKIKAIDPKTSISGSKFGVLMKCHVGGTDVRALTAFRRDLKEHPTLAKLFPVINFDVSYRQMDQKEFAEKFSLDFEVFLANTGQTKDTPMPVPTSTGGAR